MSFRRLTGGKSIKGCIWRSKDGAKSRKFNAEMLFKTPKTHLGEFKNTLYLRVENATPNAPPYYAVVP